MTEHEKIAILMLDYCTEKEAIKHLKNGTMIYSDPNDFLQEYNQLLTESGEEPVTLEDLRKNPADVSFVTYNDHEYLIMYCL